MAYRAEPARYDGAVNVHPDHDRLAAGAGGPSQLPRTPSRLVIATIVGFWVLYFVLLSAKGALGNYDDQAAMMLRRAGVAIVGIGLTMILWMVLRSQERRPVPQLVGLVFATAVPLSFAYASVNFVAFYLIAPPDSLLEEIRKMPPTRPFSPSDEIIALALSWYFFIVAWGILYIALAFAQRVRFAERQAALYRSQAQAAQLRALRYQINPHFLFNTLNSLSALTLTGRAGDAERMIANLSTFFRTSLAAEPEADVTLAEEVDLQRLYLDIEKVRFPDRLHAAFDIPADAARARVPGMILQPLIENAIKHGVARSKRPVTITLTARAERDRLRLLVEDDAVADDPFDAAPGTGTGFRNVCARLQARFGAAALCQSGPRPGGGWRVELVLPRHG